MSTPASYGLFEELVATWRAASRLRCAALRLRCTASFRRVLQSAQVD